MLTMGTGVMYDAISTRRVRWVQSDIFRASVDPMFFGYTPDVNRTTTDNSDWGCWL